MLKFRRVSALGVLLLSLLGPTSSLHAAKPNICNELGPDARMVLRENPSFLTHFFRRGGEAIQKIGEAARAWVGQADSSELSWITLKRLFGGKKFSLSDSERELVEQNWRFQAGYSCAAGVNWAARSSVTLVHSLFRYWHWRPMIMHTSNPSHGFIRRFANLVQSTSIPLLRLALPFGEFLPARWEGETAPEFEKLARDPDYEPDALSEQMLFDYRVLERFQEEKRLRKEGQRFDKLRRGWWFTRRMLHRAASAVIVAGTSLAVNLAVEIRKAGPVSVEEHIHAAEYRLQDDEIAFLQETVPFPHTAVQIGDTVYSPGQERITATPAGTYFRTRRIQQIARERGWAPEEAGPEGSYESAQGFVMDKLNGLFERTGWSEQPRSVQVVVLDLNVERVRDLEEYWIDQVGKRYANKTMVWDCASESLYALDQDNKLPLKSLYDASPSGLTMMFAAMKTSGLGPYKVDRIYMVAPEESDRYLYHLSRNAWVNMAEIKLFTHFFLYNQGARVVVDVRTDPEDRRYFEPGMEEVREKIAEDARAWVETNEALVRLGDNARYLGEQGSPGQRRRYVERNIIPIYDREIAEAEDLIQASNTPGWMRFEAIARKAFLETLRDQALGD